MYYYRLESGFNSGKYHQTFVRGLTSLACEQALLFESLLAGYDVSGYWPWLHTYLERCYVAFFANALSSANSRDEGLFSVADIAVVVRLEAFLSFFAMS